MKFAIIGLGSIAEHHIRSIMESPLCELTAVCSRNSKKLREASQKYNITTYTDYSEMVVNPDIDIVSICTPSGFHLEPAVAAANAGKHVIVEKPLEITVQRASGIVEACRKSKVKLSCIFQNRYNSEFQSILTAVESGKLGKLLLGNAYVKWFRGQEYYDSTDWRGTKKGDGGAALINQSIHTIDLLLQVFGPVKSVTGKVKTLSHKIEGEDIGLAILEFENGALGTIEGSTSIIGGYPEKLEIHGESGNIILEGGKIIQWDIPGSIRNGQNDMDELKSGSSDPMAISHALHKKQIEAFVESINNNSEGENTEDMLRPIEVIEAIYESSKTGTEINLSSRK